MKILFFSHYGAMYGANRSLLSMVQGLQAKGVTVQVWCPKEGGFTKELKATGVPYEIVAFKNWADTFLLPGYWRLPLSYFQNQSMLPKLIGKVRAFDPDIIHTNSTVLGMGAYIAEQLEIPHVWHIREMARMQFNMRFFPGISHFHKYLLKVARCIVISDAVKNEVIGDRDLPISKVFNGVIKASDLEKGLPISKSKKEFIFLAIGMIHPIKNQLLAVQGFSKIAKDFPHARLLIVGTGRRLYLQKLKTFCKIQGIEDQVTFAGFVSDPKSVFKESDVVLMCSENEAMGRVTVEAMAYGKPLIGLRSGATPELIEHGKEGVLFDKNPDDLARQMRYFLENPEALKTMGEAGFNSAKEKFTIDTYVDKMYAIFADLIK